MEPLLPTSRFPASNGPTESSDAVLSVYFFVHSNKFASVTAFLEVDPGRISWGTI